MAMLLIVALSGALASGVGRPAFAQSEQEAAGDRLRVIVPEKTIALDPHSQSSGLYPSSDGRHVYTRLKTPAINLWSLLVTHTPELLLTVLGGILLAYALLYVYRHRKGGVLHCRKCWYQLINFTGDRCPECGVELTVKNRSYRRSVRLRMIQIAVLLVLGAGAYYLGSKNRWVFQQTRIQKKYYWKSTALYQSEIVRRWFPQWNREHQSQVDQIVQIDLASGKIRKIRSLPYRKIEKWTIDSEARVISLIEFGRLTQIEAHTGDVIREYDLQDSPLNILSTDGVKMLVGGPSPEILFAASRISGAYRFDLERNEMEQIVDAKKGEGPDTPSSIFYDPVHQQLLISHWIGTYPNWQVWDESAGELHTHHAVEHRGGSVGIVYNHVRGIIYTGNMESNCVEAYDVHSEELIASWSSMDEQIVPDRLLFDDRVLLARSWLGPDMYVFDTVTGKALARLTGLSGNAVPRLITSQGENRKLIVHASDRVNVQELAIFDLSDLLTPD